MTEALDLLVVGAGPAGMSAAIRARALDLSVLVVDEQQTPGGQIWRGIETVGKSARAKLLGAAYVEGIEVAQRFRKSGATFEAKTSLWHVEPGPRAFLKADGKAYDVAPKALLLATGAQERSVPFLGWTLPGVMTVGAGQILLKSANQIPNNPVWIAGGGPLALLYAIQLLDAGAEIAGFLDTTPKGRTIGNLPSLLRAAWGAPGDLVKGVKWLTRLRAAGNYVAYVSEIRAAGTDRLERITYALSSGKVVTIDARLLMVHEGIVPIIHPTMSLGCDHVWNDRQDSYAPRLDEWGETSEKHIYVAGDGAGIGGANAACLRGEITAIGIAQSLGYLSRTHAEKEAAPLRKQLAKALSPRPFLDYAYRPRPQVFAPSDEAIACRCEEVTVGQIREVCAFGHGDSNQVKAATRAGMGACQGRLCNYTVANIIAASTQKHPADIGVYRVRPPFKSLTMEELSSLDEQEVSK